MKFVIIAKDAPDALERRMACREAHVALIDEMKVQGHFQLGGAIINDNDEMAGSVLIGDFESREALEAIWLSREPYMTNRVWETVEIHPYKIGPSFAAN